MKNTNMENPSSLTLFRDSKSSCANVGIKAPEESGSIYWGEVGLWYYELQHGPTVLNLETPIDSA